MPAAINEAFKSPFDKVSGQGWNPSPGSGSSADSQDIRNPDVQNLDFSALSGGQQPNQQNYQVQTPTVAPPSGITWGQGHGNGYNTLPHAEPNQLYQSQPVYGARAQAPMPSPNVIHANHGDSGHEQLHNCDRLIGEIMSCRVCRQKLQRLLKAWDEDHPEVVQKRGSGSEQEGGALSLPFPLRDLSPNLITNIIIGIAIIFLLDRILKLRL